MYAARMCKPPDDLLRRPGGEDNAGKMHGGKRHNVVAPSRQIILQNFSTVKNRPTGKIFGGHQAGTARESMPRRGVRECGRRAPVPCRENREWAC